MQIASPSASVAPLSEESAKAVTEWLGSDLFVPEEGTNALRRRWLERLKTVMEGLAFRGEFDRGWFKRHIWPSRRERLKILPSYSKAGPGVLRYPFLAGRLEELLPHLPEDRKGICADALKIIRDAIEGKFPPMREKRPPSKAKPTKRSSGPGRKKTKYPLVGGLSDGEYAEEISKTEPWKTDGLRKSRVAFYRSGIFEPDPALPPEEKEARVAWLTGAKKAFPFAYSGKKERRKEAAVWFIKNFFRSRKVAKEPSGSAGSGDMTVNDFTIAPGLNRLQFISRAARIYQDLGAGSEIFRLVLRRAASVSSHPLYE